MHALLDRRPRVLVADPIAPAGLELLEGTAEVDVRLKLTEPELVDLIPSYAALLVRSETRVTAAVIEAGTGLRVIGRAGVGVDNIDVEAATRRGILVVNAPTGNTVAAAEHTLALMLALARNIPQGDSSLRQGRWERSRLVGTELRGKTL
ncbi:MAG: phosphoglycerate dehydrogenase, partial [Candidatus Dormibacteraeota bacterium]|nr:phosphoglycerate dehydrogenase [Candidatus Dormibacteraeota bacterium]